MHFLVTFLKTHQVNNCNLRKLLFGNSYLIKIQFDIQLQFK